MAGDNRFGANADRCIFCGAVIPEGRQVCPMCVAMVINSGLYDDKDTGQDMPDKGERDVMEDGEKVR